MLYVRLAFPVFLAVSLRCVVTDPAEAHDREQNVADLAPVSDMNSFLHWGQILTTARFFLDSLPKRAEQDLEQKKWVLPFLAWRLCSAFLMEIEDSHQAHIVSTVDDMSK